MFRPLNNRVLILPDEVKTETSFGLIIPEDGKTKPVTGVVIVGNETIKENDEVLFSKYGYDEVEIDKKLYYVVSEENVLGIF